MFFYRLQKIFRILWNYLKQRDLKIYDISNQLKTCLDYDNQYTYSL